MTEIEHPLSGSDTNKSGYQEVEHTADCALRIYAGSLDELMQQAALGMNSLMGISPPESVESVDRQFEFDACDTETLLVEWLSELAYLAEDELLIFDRFHMKQVSPTHLKATARGYRAAGLKRCIKAVTYHNLNIIKTDRGLETTIVFDV